MWESNKNMVFIGEFQKVSFPMQRENILIRIYAWRRMRDKLCLELQSFMKAIVGLVIMSCQRTGRWRKKKCNLDKMMIRNCMNNNNNNKTMWEFSPNYLPMKYVVFFLWCGNLILKFLLNSKYNLWFIF